jgi:type IV pilus assembly protein PilA
MEQVRKRHRVHGFSLLVGAITFVIFWMSVPRSCGDQMAAREIAVLREVLRINTAQAQYRSRFGKFASTLAQLGPPSIGVAGPPGPAAADLIPASLASGEKDGYTFILTATPQG